MTFVAINPTTGARVRTATQQEADIYLTQKVRHPAFRKAVRVGDVLVDEDTGPGVWFGGAGF